MRRTRLLTAMFYVLGLGLLLTAWIFGNPPGASPDEASHFVRAVGAASGTIIGEPGGYGDFPRYSPLEVRANYSDPVHPYAADLTPFAGVNAYTRSYEVPAGLEPASFGCNAFQPGVSAACSYGGSPPQVSERWLSQHAGQNPLPYLLAGPLMVTQTTPQDADWVGRSVLAVWCLLLIGLPLLVAGRYRGRIILGLVVALTPMAMFSGAILNPSGIEIFSSVGFFIALLGVVDGQHPRLAMTAAAFTGTFVTMSRPFGPLWILMSLLTVASLLGVKSLLSSLRRTLWFSIAAAALIGLGTVSTLLILSLYTKPADVHVPRLAAGQMRDIANMAVGDFGWVDTPMPGSAVEVWLVILVSLTLLALVLGNPRERATVAINTVVTYSVVYELSLRFLAPQNVGPQGRHFLPILALQPMTTIFVIAGQRRRVRAFLIGIPVALMVLLQLIGWLANGTRQGLGIPDAVLRSLPSVSVKLFQHPAWAPPGGFLPWFVLLLLGLLSLGTAASMTLVMGDSKVSAARKPASHRGTRRAGVGAVVADVRAADDVVAVDIPVADDVVAVDVSAGTVGAEKIPLPVAAAPAPLIEPVVGETAVPAAAGVDATVPVVSVEPLVLVVPVQGERAAALILPTADETTTLELPVIRDPNIVEPPVGVDAPVEPVTAGPPSQAPAAELALLPDPQPPVLDIMQLPAVAPRPVQEHVDDQPTPGCSDVAGEAHTSSDDDTRVRLSTPQGEDGGAERPPTPETDNKPQEAEPDWATRLRIDLSPIDRLRSQ